MVNWRNLTAMATRTADRAFGEPVRLSFYKAGAADGSRAAQDLRAQVHLPGETDIGFVRGNKAMAAAIVGGAGLVIIQKSVFDGALAQGDKVRATARSGQPWFEVAFVDNKSTDQIVAAISASKSSG